MKSSAENVVFPFIQSTDDGKTVATFSCQAASSSTRPAAFSLLTFFTLHKVKVLSVDELKDSQVRAGSGRTAACEQKQHFRRLSAVFHLFGQLLAVRNFSCVSVGFFGTTQRLLG